MNRSSSVYIAYSKCESEWVQQFVDALKGQGVDVWFDQERLRLGDDVRKATESAMRHSDSVVCVVNQKSAQDPHLLFEIGAAMGMGKRVIPVVEPNLDPSSIPVDLRMRQWLTRDEPEKTAAKVASNLSVRKLAAVPAATAH